MFQFDVFTKTFSCYRASFQACRKQLLSHFTLILFPMIPNKTILQLQRCLPFFDNSRCDLGHWDYVLVRFVLKKEEEEEEEENSMETTKNSEHYTAASLNFLERKYFHLILCTWLPVLTDIINYFQSQQWLWPAILVVEWSDYNCESHLLSLIFIFSLSLFFVSFRCCCCLFALILCILSFEASKVLKSEVTNQAT